MRSYSVKSPTLCRGGVDEATAYRWLTVYRTGTVDMGTRFRFLKMTVAHAVAISPRHHGMRWAVHAFIRRLSTGRQRLMVEAPGC